MTAVLFFSFLSLTQSSAFAKEAEIKPTVSSVDSRINSIRSVLKRLLEMLAKAKAANDIQKVNCIQIKVNVVKGLLKASEKANLVFLEANYSKDMGTADAYAKKINMYGNGADDIGKSLDECSSSEVKTDGTSLVYIRPEEPEMVTSETNPWGGTSGNTGADGFPVVPPASPFR